MTASSWESGLYAPGHEGTRSFDLYRPVDPDGAEDLRTQPESPAPLLVYVHGGAWRFGDKSTLRDPEAGVSAWLRPLLDAGFAVASINYRLSDAARFPAQLHDLKAAIRYFRSRAREYGIDPEGIWLMGGSAGGHLVQLAAATADSGNPYLEGEEHPGVSSSIRCAVSVYGVSDLRTIFDDRVACGQPRDHEDDDGAEWRLMGSDYPAPPGAEAARAWAAGQPIDYQRGDLAAGTRRPTYFLHGTADGVVPWNQSEKSFRALQNAGVPTGLDLVTGGVHGDPAVYRAPGAFERMLRWVLEQLD